jgi:hypothetical protein
MGNNQEHKIDKIFRETFENQSFTPPTDAWMGIHTYTIGQEESKKKIWLRYASLALLLLLISSLGLWYFVDDQVIKSANNSSSPVAGLPTSPLVRKHTQKSILPTTGIAVASISPCPIVQKHIPTLLTQEVDWSGDKPQGEEVVSGDTDHGGTLLSHELLDYASQWKNTNNGENGGTLLSHELLDYASQWKNTNNGDKYKIVEIDSKPLIINDLTDKMQKESEKRIVALVEKLDYKKEIYKPDSVVYGKKFSLKHPIINFRLGLYNNSVKMSKNQGGEIPFANDVINSNNIYGISGIFNLAWKLNKESRISLNFRLIHFSSVNAQSKSGAAYIDPLSPTNKPTGTFKYNPSEGVYEYLTPFGYVTQPVDPKFSFTPKDFDVRLYSGFSTWQIGTNYEHDLIAFKNKKGGIPAMEIYGLVGLNIQKINKYSYSYSLFKNYDPKDNNINILYNIPTYTQTELGNGSPIVLGYNTGLGIRFQLTKRFGLNISGNYENSINSWVKDMPFTTRLSVMSVEGGFFVNL